MKPLGMTYYRRVTASGYVETLQFSTSHMKEAGLSEHMSWIPVVEGLMLVNKWNQESNGNYQYFLK